MESRLSIFIFLALSAYLGACSPFSLQIAQNWDVEETETLERYERHAGSGGYIGSGSGSGDDTEYPCGDDEDCYGRYSMTSIPEPRIGRINVETRITARYVSTVVITEIENYANVSQDSDFRFRLSKEAFISDFFMVINGKVYQSEVREKGEAQKAYNEAKRQGLSAAQVKQSDNDLTKFETNVNLSPRTIATFHLTFQELLQRKNGVFRHRINLYPKEIVQNLRADVYITEPQGISFANITWDQDDSLTTDFLYDALLVKRQSDSRIHATFTPSHVDQEGLSKTGLQGDLIITYDVVHDSGAGNIEVVNGYFVHHISPEGLPITPKNVIFVIDVSGSMNDQHGLNIYGSKMDQTKLAMETIVDDLRDFDYFNIICFSHELTQWKDFAVEATTENKMNSIEFVNSLIASGGTDLHRGVIEAIDDLKGMNEQGLRNALSMIILLTDGQPTSGVTSSRTIIREVTEKINGEIALFSLAFGAYADYNLLKKLSGHNKGLARKIYHDSSPSLQLSGFYKEVATPILHNIDVKYFDNAVDMETLTKTNFISYFEGTELVIAGKLHEDYKGNALTCNVAGNSYDVTLKWEMTTPIQTHQGGNSSVLKPHEVDNFAERLWAYVTVKELLRKIDIALTTEHANSLKEKAIKIALKYKFVTPLTSLIVIKPEDNYDDIFEGEETEGEVDETGADDVDDIPDFDTAAYSMSYEPSFLSLPGSGHNTFPHLQHQSAHSFVDGDPHVFVSIPHQNASICFEIKGEDGMIVNLLIDNELGININAVIHSLYQAEDTTKSFFSKLGLSLGNQGIIVTPRNIVTERGLTLDWKTKSGMGFGDFMLTVEPNEKMLVISHVKGGVLMFVKRHSDLRQNKIRNRGHYREEHLGLYFEETTGFSTGLSGILGQFYSPSHDIRITPVDPSSNQDDEATLTVDDTIIPVVRRERHHQSCWHALHDAAKMLDPSVFEVESLI